MSLQTYLVSHEYVPNIGIETDSGQHYLSLPMGGRLVDYEEYYRIDADDSTRYLHDVGSALKPVKHCRRQQMDHLLLAAPGDDRGSAL